MHLQVIFSVSMEPGEFVTFPDDEKGNYIYENICR